MSSWPIPCASRKPTSDTTPAQPRTARRMTGIDPAVAARASLRPSITVLGVIELRIASGGFDHCAIGAEVAAQDRQRAFTEEWIGQGPDDVVIVYLGADKVLTQRLAGDGQA